MEIIDKGTVDQGDCPSFKIVATDQLGNLTVPTSAIFSMFDIDENDQQIGDTFYDEEEISDLDSTFYINLLATDTIPLRTGSVKRYVLVTYVYNSTLGNGKVNNEAFTFGIRTLPGLS